MRKKYFNALLLILFIALASACASARRAADDRSATIAEDLSKYRPKFNLPAANNNAGATNNTITSPAVTPTNHVNAKVATLMDTVANMNKSIRFAEGYRILAYSGMERKSAMDIRTAIITRLPDEPVYPQYKQPTWRIKVGDYFTRIEAQQVLLRIKDIAPNATIVVDQINVK